MTKIMVVDVVLGFALAGCAVGQSMPARSQNIWQIVDDLSREVPLSRHEIEEAVGVPFLLQQQDKYKLHWVGSSISLTDGSKIMEASLVLNPDGRFDSTSGATIHLAGRCIRLAEVRQHSPGVSMIDSPRSPSPDEETVYESIQTESRTIFSFKESGSGCLSYVTIRSR